MGCGFGFFFVGLKREEKKNKEKGKR